MKCRDADATKCQKETFCDGKSASCPLAESMKDGTECIDRSVCIPLFIGREYKYLNKKKGCFDRLVHGV